MGKLDFSMFGRKRATAFDGGKRGKVCGGIVKSSGVVTKVKRQFEDSKFMKKLESMFPKQRNDVDVYAVFEPKKQSRKVKHLSQKFEKLSRMRSAVVSLVSAATVAHSTDATGTDGPDCRGKNGPAAFVEPGPDCVLCSLDMVRRQQGFLWSHCSEGSFATG